MCPSEFDARVSLLVRVRFGGGNHTLVGLPFDLTRTSVAVVFPDGPARPLPGITEKVRLTFSGPCLATALECEALTMYRAAMSGVARLRFQVSAAAEHTLRRFPLRREAFRAIVSTRVPSFVEVVAASGQDPVWAEINDVSLGGLSFHLTDVEDPGFMVGEMVSLTFSLPDMVGQICLVGSVRYRTSADGNSQYGVRFEFNSTEHPEAMRETITEYILTRQLNLLQALNSDESS